jgi:hypothetical protein
MVEYPLPVLGQTQYLTNSKIYFSFFSFTQGIIVIKQLNRILDCADLE